MERLITEGLLTPKILEVIMFACRAHALQSYDGEGYHKHLIDTVCVLVDHGETREHMIIGAILHDILEDTGYSYAQIKRMFGHEEAEIAYLCWDFKGRGRKERKCDELYKELAENLDATKVKVADRIANSRSSIGKKLPFGDMYIKEYGKFRGFLYVEGHIDSMWEELDKLMGYKG